MRINSLKKRFERHCDFQGAHDGPRERERFDELKRAIGYVEYGRYGTGDSRAFALGPPRISIAERLTAIEKYLGIEVVRDPERVMARRRVKKTKAGA